MKVFCFIFLFLFTMNFSKSESIPNESVTTFIKEKTIKETNPDRFVNVAKINILNKTTGKTVTLTAYTDSVIKFERIEIVPLKCWKSYPEEAPENKLLIKVIENNISNDETKIIFFGWIFSSSPSISGLEHSLYDITLIDCFNEQY